MKVVNIHEAKTQLSKLVAAAAAGEPFVIARAGKPLVQVTPIVAAARPSRLGALSGRVRVPEDFDRMAADEIGALFASETPRGPAR
jgi:prevent-host-death family protein